jgi:hypothetical protein
LDRTRKRRRVPSGGRHPLHHRNPPHAGRIRLLGTKGHDRLARPTPLTVSEARSYHLALASRAPICEIADQARCLPPLASNVRKRSRRSRPAMGRGSCSPSAQFEIEQFETWPRAASGGEMMHATTSTARSPPPPRSVCTPRWAPTATRTPSATSSATNPGHGVSTLRGSDHQLGPAGINYSLVHG